MGAHLVDHLAAVLLQLLADSSPSQPVATVADQFEFLLVSQVLSDSKELLVAFHAHHIPNSETSRSTPA
jgi:hypothetical protein